MTSKLIGAIALAAVLVPTFVLAQTPTTGLLTVYVQVLNQSGYTYTPGNFTVAVTGGNPSLNNFQGSQSGTLLSLTPGAYSVRITNLSNISANYSTGCTNTIAAGGTHTCVITINPGTLVTTNPSPYPYPYTATPPLTCRNETPTVALGQSARFSAVGGVGGTYNWMTPSRNFPNVGPVLTTTFSSSGTHTVTVTNGAQTATCTITVTTSYYPQPQNPGTPVYPGTPAYVQPFSYGYPYSVTYPQQPVLTSYVYPRFPNTGFEPVTSAQLAFATVLLMGAAIAAYPYGRKAFAFAVR